MWGECFYWSKKERKSFSLLAHPFGFVVKYSQCVLSLNSSSALITARTCSTLNHFHIGWGRVELCSTNGTCQSCTTVGVVWCRPWQTSLSPALFQPWTVAWEQYVLRMTLQPTGWIKQWWQHLQNEVSHYKADLFTHWRVHVHQLNLTYI